MKVSVIIPVFNTERYVAQAIESVLDQTRPPDEVVVVDDGSTDRTPEILRWFAPRVVLLRQERAGPSIALNTGIARATGTHLAFNDADDLWMPEKLERQCAVFASRPDVDAVFGRAHQFLSPDWVDGESAAAAALEDQPGICRAAMVIERAAFDRVGHFDGSLKVVDFIDWYGRALQSGLRSYMLPELVVRRRIHATNTGRIQRHAQRDENLLVLKRLLDKRRGGRAVIDAVLETPNGPQAS